jgi:hypothetical protein
MTIETLEAQLGLILTLDHIMFVGVMTMALFGVMAEMTHRGPLAPVDKMLLGAVTLGISDHVGLSERLSDAPHALERPGHAFHEVRL